MKKDYVMKRVIDKVSVLTQTDPITINENTNMYGDLGVDSLDMMEIIMEFEKEFGINIPHGAMSECSYIGDIVDYIDKHVAV